MQKLTDIKNNIFTTKLIDVILPKEIFIEQELITSLISETSEKSPENF